MYLTFTCQIKFTFWVALKMSTHSKSLKILIVPKANIKITLNI